MSLIQASDLSVRLGGAEILRGISFGVRCGEWIGVVGPNGSGKTTLLRTVAGLLPYSGSLVVDSSPVQEWRTRDLARRLAFVRQVQALAFELSVRDFVILGRSPHRGWLEPFTTEDWARVQSALDAVDLGDFGARSITTLSGGELQRARLAQALVQDADILLLDEPTSNLDVHHQLDLMERTAELVRDGRTVMSALHDLALAARYVDRLLVLDRGRIAAQGHPTTILSTDLLRQVFRVEAIIPPHDPSAIQFVAPA